MSDAVQQQREIEYSPSNPALYEVLLLFLGGLGVHRIYIGKISGLLFIFTFCGFFGLWPLIDLVVLAAGRTKDSAGRPLRITTGERVVAVIMFVLGVIGGVVTAILVGAFAVAAGKAAHEIDRSIKQGEVEMRKLDAEFQRTQRKPDAQQRELERMIREEGGR